MSSVDDLMPRLPELLALDDDDFGRRFRDSAIKRTKRRGLLRNAAVALGNTRNPDAVAPSRARSQTESEPLIRSHAAWALGRSEESRRDAHSSVRSAIATPRCAERLRRARNEIDRQAVVKAFAQGKTVTNGAHAMNDARREFATLAAKEPIPLARGALLIAKEEYPDLDIDQYLDKLAALAREAEPIVSAGNDTIERIQLLSHFLFEQKGFEGNRRELRRPAQLVSE